MYRSEVLYNYINEFITDDEIYPICIPSYSRPDGSFLVDAKNKNLPVYLFIRREQEQLYAQYKGVYNIVLVDNVHNIGETRKAIVDWAIKNNYDNIFMLDDDISNMDFTMPGQAMSGRYYMKRRCTLLHLKEEIQPYVFKMWQWLIGRCDPKLTLSSPGYQPQYWDLKNADLPIQYNASAINGCFHVNVKNLTSHNLNYLSSNVCGNEDYSIQYLVMRAGLLTTIFKDLTYNTESIGTNEGGCNAADPEPIKERYIRYINLFNTNVLDPEDSHRMTTKVSKSGVPSLKFLWKFWKPNMTSNYTVDDILNYKQFIG